MAKGKSATTDQKADVAPRKTRSSYNAQLGQTPSPPPSPSQKRQLPDSAVSQQPSKRQKRTLERSELEHPSDRPVEQESGESDARIEQDIDNEPQPLDVNPAEAEAGTNETLPLQQPPSPRPLEDIERADPPSPQTRHSHDTNSLAGNSPQMQMEDKLGVELAPINHIGQQPSPGDHEREESIIRKAPIAWMREQLFQHLRTLSKQILTLFCEIKPAEWLEITESSGHSALYLSWLNLQSVFRSIESAIAPDGLLMSQPLPLNMSEGGQQIRASSYYLTNFTSALSILVGKDRNYNELKQVNDKFSALFGTGSTELHDWQIDLGLDIRKETWRIGVQTRIFSKLEGLKLLFESNPTSTSDGLKRKILEHLADIKDNMEQHLHGEINFGKMYGHQLRQLAQQAVQFMPASQDPKADFPNDPSSEDLEKSSNSLNEEEQTNSVRRLAAAAHMALKDQSETDPLQQGAVAGTQDEQTAAPPMADPKGSGMVAFGESLWSTREAYERAKLAAAEKAAARNKGVPLQPSQRRPWSPEEENALMTGLDRVQGPHWSQILAMYGPGGSISEVLKDRNQVQLKDKARNLKLFFLKSGHEVPHYLKNVTGELKTRAPARAGAGGNEDSALEDVYNNQLGGNSSRPNQFLTAHLYPRAAPDKGSAADQDSPNDQDDRSMEDEKNLSNAIQLALQAIQEKNGPQGDTEEGTHQDDEVGSVQRVAEPADENIAAAGF